MTRLDASMIHPTFTIRGLMLFMVWSLLLFHAAYSNHTLHQQAHEISELHREMAVPHIRMDGIQKVVWNNHQHINAVSLSVIAAKELVTEHEHEIIRLQRRIAALENRK